MPFRVPIGSMNMEARAAERQHRPSEHYSTMGEAKNVEGSVRIADHREGLIGAWNGYHLEGV